VIPVTATAEKAPTKIACHFYLDDIIAEPFEYRDGALLVPDRPGLGIVVDEQKLKKYSIA
jgi:muconate cycloisomerase